MQSHIFLLVLTTIATLSHPCLSMHHRLNDRKDRRDKRNNKTAYFYKKQYTSQKNTNQRDYSELDQAIHTRNIQLIEKLIFQGFNPYEINRHGSNALQKILLTVRGSLRHTILQTFLEALERKHGRKYVTKFVNTSTQKYSPALHLAISQSDETSTDLLLQWNAQIEIIDHQNKNALQEAVFIRDRIVRDTIITKLLNSKPNNEILKVLLTPTKGNTFTKGHDIPLLIAARAALKTTTVLLLKAMSTHAQNGSASEFFNFFILSQQARDTETCELLRAIINLNHNQTRLLETLFNVSSPPLLLATQKGFVETVDLMLQLQIDPYVQDLDQNNVIHRTLFMQNKKDQQKMFNLFEQKLSQDTLRTLCNQSKLNGGTPLSVTVSRSNLAMFTRLLPYTNPLAQEDNSLKNTILHLIMKVQDDTIRNTMLKLFAEIYCKEFLKLTTQVNNKNETPYDILYHNSTISNESFRKTKKIYKSLCKAIKLLEKTLAN